MSDGGRGEAWCPTWGLTLQGSWPARGHGTLQCSESMCCKHAPKHAGVHQLTLRVSIPCSISCQNHLHLARASFACANA